MYTNGDSKVHDPNQLADSAFISPRDLLPKRPSNSIPFPTLPDNVKHDPGLASEASPWLDSYIRFSRRWSPRAHDDFHESVGLWLLSTVAARRVAIDLGKRRYTSLYIALTSRTSVFAKSTTAEIAQEVLKEAGLSHLLASDDATPQAFVRSMTYRLPSDWGELSPELQDYYKRKLAFASQKGWFFDEFGQKVSAMMREGGHMADFRGLLRKFDDTPRTYEYDTIGRGKDLVHAPYLALLANLTPADLLPYAKRGAALWNDGFWARFAFLTPPMSAVRKNGRFPSEERRIPEDLSTPIRRWHQRLGIPNVEITEQETDTGKVKYELLVVPPHENLCILGDGVYEAFYSYNDALIDIVTESSLTDLDGNYSRLPEKALRAAMLLGSLENNNRIEMIHWARAQQIAEVWRRNLHNLYDQIVGTGEEPKIIGFEDRIMQLITEKGPRTLREMCQGIWGMDTGRAKIIATSMVEAGFLKIEKEGRAERYRMAAAPESVEV